MRPVALRLAAVLLAVAAAGSAAVHLAAQQSSGLMQSSANLAAPSSGAATRAVSPASPAVSGSSTGAAAPSSAAVRGAPSPAAPAPSAPRPAHTAAVSQVPDKASANPNVSASPASGTPRSQPAPEAAPGTSRHSDTGARSERRGFAHRTFHILLWLKTWLWNLGGDAKPLQRGAIAAIALLAAFLTVVQIWQIPPPSTPLALPPGAPATVPEAPARDGAAAGKPPGPFDGNFARTVFTGLGGMFLVTFLDSLWATNDGKSYYLVLFVIFFLAILSLSALLRAAGEALRSRVAAPYLAPVREGARGELTADLVAAVAYRIRRAWGWLLSWRKTLLVFWDTVFAVIQGKNQLQSVVFESYINDLQTSLVHAAQQVGTEVHEAVVQALRQALWAVGDSDIRVNISIMADDEKSVFYVAREAGSLYDSFPRHSLAWVSAYYGQALWWRNQKEVYSDDVELLAKMSGEGIGLRMKDYFQPRQPIDYKAFIMLPIPWARRGLGTNYRKATLHISFREDYLDQLWQNLEIGQRPNYDGWKGLLERPPGPQEGTGGASPPEPPNGTARLPQAGAQLAEAAALAAQDAARVAQAAARLAEDAARVARAAATAVSHAAPYDPPAPRRAPDHEPHIEDIQAHDPTLVAVLKEALNVLGEVLRHFDQQVFEDYVRPRLEW